MTAAIILAGGRSSRLGQPKELLKADGRTLLQRTVDACHDCDPVVVVGPDHHDLPNSVIQVREEPAYGGPVAAIAAGVRHIGAAEDVIVLACDMPRVGDVARRLLNARTSTDDGVHASALMVRDRDRLQPLATLWNAGILEHEIDRAHVVDRSMRSLMEFVDVTVVDVPDGLTHDIDEPSDLAALWPATDVQSVMLTTPDVLPATATVGDVRHFLASQRTHLALIAGAQQLITTITPEDLDPELDDAAPAASVGTTAGRTTTPNASVRAVASEMIRERQRRRVVLDDDGVLVGLLCLNRRGDGFCRDDDVHAHRTESAESACQTSQA